MQSTSIAKKTKFITLWGILAFAISVSFVLILLHPREVLLERIKSQVQANELTIMYLKNLLQTYPNNFKLRLLLAEQEIKLNKMDDAKKDLQPLLALNIAPGIRAQAILLDYDIAFKQTFALPENSPERAKAITELKQKFVQLPLTDLNDKQLLTMAQQATALDEPKRAAEIYQRLQASNTKLSGWQLPAAKVALSIGEYQQSADYYLLALKNTAIPAKKREFLVAAIKALQAGDQLNKAIDICNQYYQQPYVDSATLTMMGHLARAANQSSQAQLYMQRALMMNHQDNQQQQDKTETNNDSRNQQEDASS